MIESWTILRFPKDPNSSFSFRKSRRRSEAAPPSNPSTFYKIVKDFLKIGRKKTAGFSKKNFLKEKEELGREGCD